MITRSYKAVLSFAIAIASFRLVGDGVRADVPRAFAQGQTSKDHRLAPLQDLDGYFPFTPPATKEDWHRRAEEVRTQLRVALGLWPMPTKTPLKAVVHGKIERPDYTVEKVYFESVPGFFVTGNLYRPVGKSGTVPGVLCPHGHWNNGRFYDQGTDAVRREIVDGAERFENGGRSPLQSRCVQLARMGCVVFHYDMIGYADSQQITEEIAHRFAKQRPEMNTVESWGLFSPQAETHCQSVMGLQTIDSIRALDFLLSLPEVDPDRIGVTGASGGGTQTFILGALDPRPAVIFPAVMVSTAMQGGCTCENASDLRVGAGNVEFAALFAPKPLGMTAANDWTKEMAGKGFPELKKLYALLGAPDQVMLKPLLHFGHNYNYVSRAAMYSWFNKQFHLGLKEPVVEEDYPRLSRDQMTVWDENHPKPEGGPEFERKLLRWLTEDATKQLKEREENWDDFKQTFGPAVQALLMRSYQHAGSVEWKLNEKNDRESYLEMSGLLHNRTFQEEVPAIFLYPKQWNGKTVIWLDAKGKAGLYDGDGNLKQPVSTLLKSGAAVAGVDLLYQGEWVGESGAPERAPTVKNPREAPAFTYGYNPSVFAKRVHDILTAITFVRHHERASKEIDLVGMGPGIGALAAAARSQAGEAVDRAIISPEGFRFGKLLDYHDLNFLPGGAKYEDVPGLLALNAPQKTWLASDSQEASQWIAKLYREVGAEKALTIYDGDKDQALTAALEWLEKTE